MCVYVYLSCTYIYICYIYIYICIPDKSGASVCPPRFPGRAHSYVRNLPTELISAKIRPY